MGLQLRRTARKPNHPSLLRYLTIGRSPFSNGSTTLSAAKLASDDPPIAPLPATKAAPPAELFVGSSLASLLGNCRQTGVIFVREAQVV